MVGLLGFGARQSTAIVFAGSRALWDASARSWRGMGGGRAGDLRMLAFHEVSVMRVGCLIWHDMMNWERLGLLRVLGGRGIRSDLEWTGLLDPGLRH